MMNVHDTEFYADRSRKFLQFSFTRIRFSNDDFFEMLIVVASFDLIERMIICLGMIREFCGLTMNA